MYIIEGTMYPGSEAASDAGTAALRKLASLEVSQSDPTSDNGYVPYVWSEFVRQKQLFVKVLYVNVEENVSQGLIKKFTLICKIKDPTIYGEKLKLASTDEAEPSSTGSAVHSFTFPIVYGATLLDVQQDALNEGDLPVYPVSINVYGPVTDPLITNTTTGDFIQLSGVTLSSQTDQLVIAYDKDSLNVNVNGVNRLANVTNSSDYFKLQPGSNIIELSGASVGSGAYLTVSYRDGWPLS
jgi:hypothetical protein